MYVVGNNYIEVIFKTDCFAHLTGVASRLGAQEFYERAKSATLTTSQFFFDDKHYYLNAKKKLRCLLTLPALTNNLVCLVKDLQTVSLTYKIGVTNLDFTLGLTDSIDKYGNKSDNYLIPRTLRVKDKAIENSKKAEFVDFIFCRDATNDKYTSLTYADKNKTPSEAIMALLDDGLKAQLYDLHKS